MTRSSGFFMIITAKNRGHSNYKHIYLIRKSFKIKKIDIISNKLTCYPKKILRGILRYVQMYFPSS